MSCAAPSTGYRGKGGYDRQDRWVFPHASATGQVNEGDYEAYGYDAAGNRTSLRKRDGTTIAYEYDALDRMTRKTVPQSAGGAAGYSVFYGYDLRDLQTFARFGSASGPGVTNAYDGFGRPSTTTTTMDGTARTLASQYDAGSRRSVLWDMGVSYSGGYSWDAAGRLTRFDEGLQSLAFRPGYDALGRRTSLAFGVGSTVSAVSYGYDVVGRLASLDHQLAGTSADRSLGFAYNPASQIAVRTSSNDSYRSTSAYAVDRPYSVNGLNQYTAAGPATFAYDANGNLRSDGAITYVYDAENRLVSATSAAGTVALAYDPLGRLWQVAGPSGTTRFLYDGDDLIQERDGNGTLLRAYVHMPGAGDEPLMWYEYTSGFSRRYLHADHQGSIVAVSDSSGNAMAITGYDAWGIPNAGTMGVQSGGVGRFGYTGQAWIPELGMYHYKARVYSPTLGRFLQTDPVGYDDQMNLYAYVANDPVNLVDTTGQAILTWTARDQVTMRINYTVDASRAPASFSPAQVSRDIANAFSGQTTINGETVTVRAEAAYVPIADSADVEDLKTITVFPHGQLPAQGVTGGRPYVADGLGGQQVHVTPAEGSPQIVHELGGHTSGAGDQYLGGIAADGSAVQVPGPGNNVMQDYRGAANPQSIREALQAPTNVNRCAEGVRSLSGAC